MKHPIFLISLIVTSCACEREIRPYKHFLYDRPGDRMVELKVGQPKIVIQGEGIDKMICQTQEGFRMKEAERIQFIERLKACESQLSK